MECRMKLRKVLVFLLIALIFHSGTLLGANLPTRDGGVPVNRPDGDFLAGRLLPRIAPAEILGMTGYYRWRYADFMRRHPGLQEPDPERIPDYYLGYGEKYVSRFSSELFPKLSEKGKKWLISTRLNLQLAIENRLRKDPVAFSSLEENPKAFRKFAFETHPASYLDSGLADLPLGDLIKIAKMPEHKDILGKEGRTQIFKISRGFGREFLKRIFRLTWNAHKMACDAARNGNADDVDQMIGFFEALSATDQRMFVEITHGFRDLRQSIQFRVSHDDDSQAWKKLLERIDFVNAKK